MHRGNRSCWWWCTGLYWVPRTSGCFEDNVLMRKRGPKPRVEPPETESLLTGLWDWTKTQNTSSKGQRSKGFFRMTPRRMCIIHNCICCYFYKWKESNLAGDHRGREALCSGAVCLLIYCGAELNGRNTAHNNNQVNLILEINDYINFGNTWKDIGKVLVILERY